QFIAKLPPALVVLAVDSAESLLGKESSSRPKVLCSPQQLAYVIYTSGSTGKPKGVMIEHEAICTHLLWMDEVYGLQTSDKVAQKTPYTFDVSVWEFFLPLISGSQLVMAKPGGHKETGYLIEFFNQHQITHTHFVPSMLY